MTPVSENDSLQAYFDDELGAEERAALEATLAGDPEARLPGSIAVALEALRQGVQVIRVHDVAETRQAMALWTALNGDGRD